MSSSLAAVSRALTARTVHLKLFPPPRNFNEQREVLRVLERFGEVTMFRFLKHRIISPVPNAFIATFTSEQSVADIISAGPIRYRMISEEIPVAPESETEANVPAEAETEPGTATFSPLSTSSSLPTQTIQPGPLLPEQELEEDSSTFELTISPSLLTHAKYLTSPHTNPLYGPYPPYPVHKSLVGSMLQKSVTSSMWAPGLRDWETDVERWRLGMGVMDGRDGLAGNEEGEAGKWGEREGIREGATERAVYTRAVQRRRERIPGIMWGVRKFIEDGKKAEGARGG